MASQERILKAAKAIESMIPRAAAINNGPIIELPDGEFIHLNTWEIAVAAVEAAD